MQAVQLEIRFTGFRDTRKNLENAAQKIAKVIRDEKMREYVAVEQREEALPVDVLEPGRQRASAKPFPKATKDRSEEPPVRERGSIDQITIDQEFERLVHDLTTAEFQQLERNVLQDGCLDPLVVWEHEGRQILLDGHHRFKICKEHGIQFDIVKMSFPDRGSAELWVIEKQIGRRNLTPFARIELLQPYDKMVRLEAREKQQQAHRKRDQQSETEAFDPVHSDEVLARLAGVSPRTYNKARYIIEHAPEEVKEQLRKAEISIDAAYKKIYKPKKDRSKKKESPAPGREPTAKDPQDGRAGPKLPPPSDVIVINKAWASSGMGIQRLTKLPMDKLAGKDAILWFWTPVKHVPNIFPVLSNWGFEFRTILAWENTERVNDEWLDDTADFFVVATKGNPGIDPHYKAGTLLKTGIKTGTAEPVGFFTIIERRCMGQARLEIFAETTREGWLVWPPVDENGAREEQEEKDATEERDAATPLARETMSGRKSRKAQPQVPESIESEGESF